GRPVDANQLEITAFAQSGEVKQAIALDQAIDIKSFPADTVQLGVEVVIGGGTIGAAGKTAPLVFDELANGDQLHVAMVPPGGFGAVGPLGDARRSPQVARAGAGVLVVGGTGATGTPLATAEFYDPATAAFTPVDVPAALVDAATGLAGVVLTP